MVTIASSLPRQLVIGDPEHAVAAFAESLAAALGDVRTSLATRVHVQFTDRLFGSSPEEAATAFEQIASARVTTVTVHDLPQPSDAHAFDRRVACYRRVVQAARGVVCNSDYEAELLERYVGGAGSGAVGVIPLPVDVPPPGPSPAGSQSARPAPAETWHRRDEVAVLGFYYPGKGHDEVIEAVAALEAPRAVTALGRASAGHECELRRTAERAARLGVRFEATGFLPADELVRRCRASAVPIAAHRHFSASASINTWISAGRRPLVPDAAYPAEMARLRPGTITLYDPARMTEAIEAAWRDPASTWLAADAVTGPDTLEVARLYRRWWERVT
ncbi:hypothetical protein [Subtercola lobariae]|uniref:Uncharacterized protein n=1 Tax=Subtercola lobariae TaxID=1588641 RepID=A0A917BG50_9MICO|nr:hypothetical protein [Subtercola lobariae]GGF41352.1 hypothetical protein GCM10011399_37560 [Subtercola lobariae]